MGVVKNAGVAPTSADVPLICLSVSICLPAPRSLCGWNLPISVSYPGSQHSQAFRMPKI